MKNDILGEEILIIYSSENVKGKHDATGAFIPEAKAFAKHHCVPKENMLGVPCTRLKSHERRKRVLDFFTRHDREHFVRLIAWFGHGWSRGIQFGFTKSNLYELVDSLKGSCAEDLSMVLYACSTASASKSGRKVSMPATDNGFADKLRDDMYEQGFRDGWVDAHLNPGHTTKNPYLLRFICNDGHYDRGGGVWLVKPKSAYWATWANAIRKTKFRYIFPTMANFDLDELPVT